MKRFRLRWAALSAVAAVVAGFLLWQRRQESDVERRLARLRAEGNPLNLAELDAWYAHVPAGENAGQLVLDHASSFRDGAIPGLVSDLPNRPKRGQPAPAGLRQADAAYLRTNAATLAALHEALRLPRSRYPIELTNGFATLLPHLGVVKQCAARLGACADMAAGLGEPGLAARCVEDQLRLARTLDEEPVLISHLVQISVQGLACASTERVLSQTALAESELSLLQNAFGSAAASHSFERALGGELALFVDFLHRPAAQMAGQLASFANLTGSGGAGGDFDGGSRGLGLILYGASGLRSRELRVLVDYLDSLRLAGRLPAPASRAEVERIQEEMRDQLRSRLMIVGRMALPPFEKLGLKAARQDAILHCAETACAVERWRLAHGGEPPPALAALAPSFLAALPVDAFDGRPLRYRLRPKGYVVYSIGEDQVDDGGSEKPAGSAQTNGWDYTFIVER